MNSILFVCLGNICRSPLAEGVFRHTVEQAGLDGHYHIDSAGTGAWHVGNPPDPRSIETAARHGIDISHQRARQVRSQDFEEFDFILAMDGSNLQTLHARGNSRTTANLRLFLDAPATDVPDPYYGGDDGFETVYQMIEKGSRHLLETLENGAIS